jgi:tRNA A-37 threonylcarbamoyl transferase component Bud32
VGRAGDIEMETEDDADCIVVVSGRLLGSGVQSKVFACAESTTNFIKTFHWRASFEVELKALRALKGVAGVPDLIAVSCESRALLTAPVGTPLRHHLDKSVRLSKVACGLVYTLRNTHALNIVHRDIGPNNIIVGEGGQGLLIDWATSTSATAEATEYQGSALFASNSVLEVCSSAPAESPVSLVYEKYMDLESLVKTMFYSMYGDYIAPVFKLKGDYAATLAFWQRCEQEHPRLSELLVAARECDYEKLHDLFII